MKHEDPGPTSRPEDATGVTGVEDASDSHAPAEVLTPSRNRTLFWTVGTVLVVATILVALSATGAFDADDGTGWSWLTGRGSEASQDSAGDVNGSSSGPGGNKPGTSGQPGGVGGGRPSEPAADGSKLTTITAPPASTLAMVEAKRLPANARYTITFRPYGYGPSGSGSTLVIRITEVTSGGGSASGFDFAGRNVLVHLAAGDDVIRASGSYTGVLTFRAQGDLLLPMLGNVQAR